MLGVTEEIQSVDDGLDRKATYQLGPIRVLKNATPRELSTITDRQAVQQCQPMQLITN